MTVTLLNSSFGASILVHFKDEEISRTAQLDQVTSISSTMVRFHHYRTHELVGEALFGVCRSQQSPLSRRMHHEPHFSY